MAWRPTDANEEQVRFIYSAVEAGWTLPRIIDDMAGELPWALVHWWAKEARKDHRSSLRICEHCRRNLATYSKPKETA